MKCPGQDSRYWDNNYIFEKECPKCKNIIEFYKDDSFRRCSKCESRVKNPKKDLGCAEYCEFAEQCIEITEE